MTKGWSAAQGKIAHIKGNMSNIEDKAIKSLRKQLKTLPADSENVMISIFPTSFQKVV